MRCVAGLLRWPWYDTSIEGEMSGLLNSPMENSPEIELAIKLAPHQRLFYRPGQKAQKVRILRQVFDWKDKQPYVPAGFSTHAVVELNAEETEAKCHHCGQWFDSVSQHLSKQGVNSSAHKREYGFTQRSSLNSSKQITHKRAHIASVNPLKIGTKEGSTMARQARKQSTAVKKIKPVQTAGGHFEAANLANKCKAQLLEELRTFAAELGHTPSQKELRQYIRAGKKPLHPNSLRYVFGCSVGAILRMAGVAPQSQKGKGAHSAEQKLRRRDECVVEIQNLASQLGRVPRSSDLKSYVRDGKHKLHPISLRRVFDMPLRRILIKCGLDPAIKRKRAQKFTSWASSQQPGATS
jgi:hypothetical protein